MKLQNRHLCFSVVCTLLLSLLFTACSGGITNWINTSTGEVPTANWPVYENHHPKNAGYTLRYPPGWQVKEMNLFVTFSYSDAHHLSWFSVSPTPESDVDSRSTSASEQDAITKYMNTFKTTAQHVTDDGIATIIYDGATSPPGIAWEENYATGDVHLQGRVINEEMSIMASYNRQQHLMYIVQYEAPTSVFPSINSTNFQPMMESFAYTS